MLATARADRSPSEPVMVAPPALGARGWYARRLRRSRWCGWENSHEIFLIHVIVMEIAMVSCAGSMLVLFVLTLNAFGPEEGRLCEMEKR